MPGPSRVEGIDGLATLLHRAGVDFGAEDIADALWLAGHIGDLASKEENEPANQSATSQTSTKLREEWVDGSDLDDEGDKGQSPLAQLSLPPYQTQEQAITAKKSGIPIKVPAAPVLRIRLDLARALRPLRRRVPSPGRVEFNEAETVERIADQGIWSPVLKPAPERWLEVALVVEDMQSLPIWQETVAEVQTLLERQGAFRRVTTWRLRYQDDKPLQLFPNWRDEFYQRQPVRAKQLYDPAGRRLILLMSDCTSEAWRKGSMQAWLAACNQHAPTTVIQLLPQRLWSQSVLSQGVAVWLSALEPGTVTAKLTVQPQMPMLHQLFSKPRHPVIMPVVTLQAEPLKQWAKVIAGSGETKNTGYQFDLHSFVSQSQSTKDPNSTALEPVSAADRVQRFRTMASLVAQKLAGLMSVAPVSPPIVDLIRQTLLREAEPVHVAEVFMGGLMQLDEVDDSGTDSTAYPQFDFAPGVRSLLSDAISKSATESVLDAVSRYISERLGLSIRNFEALLSIDFQGDENAENLVLPFAEIATQTLERMGGVYAEMAQQLAVLPKTTFRPTPLESTESMGPFPPLQPFTFNETVLLIEADAEAERQSQAEKARLERVEREVKRYKLSPRQAEVWRLSHQGQSYAQIAGALGISVHRIQEHIQRICSKRRDTAIEESQPYGCPLEEAEVRLLYTLGYEEDEVAKELSISADAAREYFERSQVRYQLVRAFGNKDKLKFAEFTTASITLAHDVTSIEGLIPVLEKLLSRQDPPHRLNAVQKEILHGAWESQSYEEIAKRFSRSSTSYLKRKGSELWGVLSQLLGEQVTKSNMRQLLPKALALTNAPEWVIRRSSCRAWHYTETLGNETDLEMVLIFGGSFMMGSPDSEEGRSDAEGPQHEVTVEPFLMGKYPVTQAQWRAVAAMPQVERELEPDPSDFKGDNRPVECVNWYDAVEFCRRLERATGRAYRLPTEAEWEYACRAGTTTPFYFGETLTSELANYNASESYGNGPTGEYRQETTSVHLFESANAFGLVDMHGNVWEWCQDHWHENYKGAPTDGSAWVKSGDSNTRVLRGGSWNDVPWGCRSAYRDGFGADDRDFNIGFRVVCSAPRILP